MKKILITSLLALLFIQGKGQDMHMSMFYDSPITVNPSNTGMFNGYHRAHIHYRTQWNSMLSKPFVNTMASYEHPMEQFGVGGYIMNTRSGIGGMNYLNVMSSGAYEVAIDPNKEHHLTCGLQVGIIYKSIHADRYLYETQYNKQSGELDASMSSNESFNKNGIVMPDVNFGAMYKENRFYNFINPYFGFTIYHLTQPKETFLGIKNRYKMRLLMHTGTRYEVNRFFTLAAHGLFMRQTNNNEFNANVIAGYKFKKTGQDVYLGLGYRSNDALMIHVGSSFKEYLIRFCYDINVSPLKSATGGYGAFEISISYALMKEKGNKSILKMGI